MSHQGACFASFHPWAEPCGNLCGHPTSESFRIGRMTIDTVRHTLQVGPPSDRNGAKWAATAAFAAGGLLIIWSSYIHFHLWQSLGYRHITTIGPLFLLQSIGGFLLGLVIIAARRVWAALLGVGFAVATMVGFFISVEHGLFGFKDTWSAPFAHEAFALELAIIGVCVIAGTLCLMGSASVAKDRHILAGVLSVAVLLILGGAILLATEGGGAAGPASGSSSSSVVVEQLEHFRRFECPHNDLELHVPSHECDCEAWRHRDSDQ